MAAIIPHNMDFAQFTALLKQDFQSANIPLALNDLDWKNQVRELSVDPAFASKLPPTPDVYSEPVAWMQAFTNAIY